MTKVMNTCHLSDNASDGAVEREAVDGRAGALVRPMRGPLSSLVVCAALVLAACGESVSSDTAKMADKASEDKAAAGTVVSDVKESVSTAISDVKASVSEAKDSAAAVASDVADSASSLGSDVKAGAADAISGVKAGTANAISDVKAGAAVAGAAVSGADSGPLHALGDTGTAILDKAVKGVASLTEGGSALLERLGVRLRDEDARGAARKAEGKTEVVPSGAKQGDAANANEASKAGLATSDAAKREMAEGEVAVANGVKTEAGKLGAEKREAAISEIAKGDATVPDAAKAEAAKHDAMTGEVAKAEASVRDMANGVAAKRDAVKDDVTQAGTAVRDSVKDEGTKSEAAAGDLGKTGVATLGGATSNVAEGVADTAKRAAHGPIVSDDLKGIGQAADDKTPGADADKAIRDGVTAAAANGSGPSAGQTELARVAIPFAFNASTFAPAHAKALDSIVAELLLDPARHAILSGHADSRGAIVHNRVLARKRAEAVRHHLLGRGVNAAQLTVRSEVGVAKNAALADDHDRRVDVILRG